MSSPNNLLDYARSLVVTADKIVDRLVTHESAQATALDAWAGPTADTMRQIDIPSEKDSLGTAVQSMKREAGEWAVLWAEKVNALNLAEFRKAQALDGRYRVGSDPAVRRSPPERPKTIVAPTTPDFSPGPAYVHYRYRVSGGSAMWITTYQASPYGGTGRLGDLLGFNRGGN